VVAEASTVIPHRTSAMLMSILDLERIHVEDIMVPRQRDRGHRRHGRMGGHPRPAARQPPHAHPVYDGSLDDLVGILH